MSLPKSNVIRSARRLDLSVLYLDTAGKKFDTDYFLKRHLHFAEKKWALWK